MLPGRRIEATEVVFTDWFPRGGDNIIMRAQAIDRAETSTLGVKITLYTKNSGDTGDGSAVQESGSSTEVSLNLGVSSVVVQQKIFESAATAATANKGLLELVRYKVEATGGSAADGKWVSIRLFPPIFFDKGK